MSLRKIYNYFFVGNPRKKAIPIVIIVAIIIAVVLFNDGGTPTSESSEVLPIVQVGTVFDVENGNIATYIGTVRAVSEAQIQSEVSGRVTSVNVRAGEEVRAGTVLATLENSTQSAALLQAQGAYEAALANAAQSEVSVGDAQNTLISAESNARSTYRSSYTTTYTAIIENTDRFFRDPNSILIPGVRIGTYGNGDYLNDTRKQLSDIFEEWKEVTILDIPSSDLDMRISEAKADTQVAMEFVDMFITLTNKADDDDTLDGVLVKSYTSDLLSARATLSSVLNSLTNAETSLAAARKGVNRAEIASTQNTEVSLANAQVKQALGSLRSAEANYEKTIFRSPISGTVNSLRINVGDFVSAFTQVAEVANNDALELSVFVGEQELSNFSIGDKLTIGDNVEGTVTSIAPAVDPVTLKTEVKIATESTDLTNGSTVTVSIPSTEATYENRPLQVPITAVKFSAEDGVIFTVEDGELVSNKVKIGNVSGSFVTILEGIDTTTEFVLDARGRSAGAKVEAVRNNN